MTLAQAPEEPPYFALERVQLTNVSVAKTEVATPAAETVLAGQVSRQPAREPSQTAPAVAEPPAGGVAAAATGDPVALAMPEPGDLEAAAEQAASVAALTATFETGASALERITRSDWRLGSEGTVRVTAIGDSVMLGAAHQLAEDVPGIDLDAAVGRQISQAIALLRERRDSGRLGPVVLLHIGNNGVFTDKQFEQVMEVVGPSRRVVFLSLKVTRSWEDGNNEVIRQGVERHRRAVLVDWRAALEEHPEVLWDDGTHLRPERASFYVELLAPYLHS